MNLLQLPRSISAGLWQLLITRYTPDPQVSTFLDRAQTHEDPRAILTVAVLDGAESFRLFGVAVARRGIQPVFLRIKNISTQSLRLQVVCIDPNYFTPLEAASVNHFSITRRLSAFGAIGWLFLPFLLLAPLKLITTIWANQRMDEFFCDRGFRLGPIDPGDTSEGFIFTTLDSGSKAVHVRLDAMAGAHQSMEHKLEAVSQSQSVIECIFTIPVPGIDADYLDRDFDQICPPASVEPCNVDQLIARLASLPTTTKNPSGSRSGDPVNLVLIGKFETLLSAFVARWDESETISLATCWKTVRDFLLGSDYRYSPVSSLHLFGRDQDIALQRTRHSINERLHLRLWLAPLSFEAKPVWVGQVSRDIGVRFTTRAWNLTTHRIDPNVDESRDYVIEDLVQAERVEAAGYVAGVGVSLRHKPQRNLTGDPYFTDGKRAVIIVAATRSTPRFVAWN